MLSTFFLDNIKFNLISYFHLELYILKIRLSYYYNLNNLFTLNFYYIFII